MAERSWAKTQLTGVTGAAVIIVMIVLVPGLFQNLPQPALATVVIIASLSLAGADPPPKWILIAAEPITDVDTIESAVAAYRREPGAEWCKAL